MKTRLFPIFSIACLSVFLCSCGGGGGDGGASPDHNSCDVLGLNARIINGTTCASGKSPVLKLFINDGNNSALCSGTLIAPTKFLTAAHCVTNGEFRSTVAARKLSVSTGNINQPLAQGIQVVANPNPVREFQVIADAANSRGQVDAVNNDGELLAEYIREFGVSDVAVITLDRALNYPTATIDISSIPSPGTIVAIFGYGISERSGGNATNELNSGEMKIDSTGSKNILARFNEGSNTCEGDSGGPMMETFSDGSYALVGTVLGGSKKDCSNGDLSSFTATAGAGIANFIRQYAPEAKFR